MENKNYVIFASCLRIGPSLIGPDYPLIFGVYKTINPEAAYHEFLKENCSNSRDAQRFNNKIVVVEIINEAHEFLLTDTYGELLKFPNRKLFTEEDYYF